MTLAYFISRTPHPGPKCLLNLKVPGRPTDSQQQASQKLHSAVTGTQTNAATSKIFKYTTLVQVFFLCFGQEDGVKLDATTVQDR